MRKRVVFRKSLAPPAGGITGRSDSASGVFGCAATPSSFDDPSSFRLRSYDGERDLPELVNLFNQCAAESPAEPTTDHEELRSDLARPEVDARNVTLVACSERIVGFAALLTHQGTREISADLWLKSMHRPGTDLDRALIEWAESRSRDLSRTAGVPVELLAMVDEDRADRLELLRQQGFSVGRHFFRMRRPLSEAAAAGDLPHGFEVRALHAPFELEAWVNSLNSAFADHWRFGAKSLAQASHFRNNDPNFRAEGEFVAIAPNGSIAGFCQCIIRDSENEHSGRRAGWISLLGVVPAYRRIGLARKLLAQGLWWLTAQGMTEALLGVDAESSTGARRLYDSAGFTVVHRRLAFIRRFGKRSSDATAVPNCAPSAS